MAHQSVGAHLQHAGEGLTTRERAFHLAIHQLMADPLGESFFRLLPRRDFALQFGGVAEGAGVKAAVLINAPHLCSQDGGQALVFRTEFVAAELVDQRQAAVHSRGRGDGHGEPGVNRRPAARESDGGRIAAGVAHADGAAFGEDGADGFGRGVQCAQTRFGTRIHATGEHHWRPRTIELENRADGKARAHHFAGGLSEAVDQAFVVQFRAELQAQIEECGEALIGRLEVGGLFGELVGDHAQVFTVEILWRLGGGMLRCEAEHPFHGTQHVLRLRRLSDNARNAARFGQRARFLLVVVGRPKDDGRGRDSRIGAQLPHQFVAIHRRHQNIGDDQGRMFGAGGSQCVGAVGSFQQAMPAVSEECDEVIAIGRLVIDNQNGRHGSVPSLERGSRKCGVRVGGKLQVVERRLRDRSVWSSSRRSRRLESARDRRTWRGR